MYTIANWSMQVQILLRNYAAINNLNFYQFLMPSWIGSLIYETVLIR